MLYNLNTLEDLFTKEELNLYRTIVRPFHLRVLGNALNKKLKTDPDYEVFVPLEFHRFAPMVRKSQDLIFKTDKALVSNRGRICTIKKGKVKFLAMNISAQGYFTSGTKFNKVAEIFPIHRLIGCLFVFPEDELWLIPLHNLQINHKDGIKTNIELSNLEWSTTGGNIKHAYDNDLNPTRPVKGVVQLGEFGGFEFGLKNSNRGTPFGFDANSIWECCTGKRKLYKGCSFSYIDADELATLPLGITEEIQNTLPAVKVYRKSYTAKLHHENVPLGVHNV